ncbi:MAG: DEAD/DEAH box helicase family protein [Promethearchaeia archaeon]
MRLLLGCIPNKEFEILNDNNKKKYYEDDFIERILNDSEIEDKELKKGILKLFAYLLDKNYLEIKLALLINEDVNLASEKEIKIYLKKGMLHHKIGIFTDKEGNQIGFIGSLNETEFAHDDSIATYKSWKTYQDEKENKHLKSLISYFNKLWNGESSHLIVFSLPNKKLKKITKFAPKEFPEGDYFIINRFYRKIEKESNIITKKSNAINRKSNKSINNPFEQINWYKPQIEGYKNWLNNQKKGILAIATGVGKTLIALRIMYEFFIEQNNLKKIATVVVPDNLAIQWKEEIEKYFSKNTHIIMLISTEKGYDIKSKISILRNYFRFYNNIIILAYYNTFAKKIIPILNKLENKFKILLIADEVHEIGTKKRRKMFSQFKPDYKLGLSATPIRKFDDEGNSFINSYFSGIVYEYSIEDAIKDGYLCPYRYYPIFYNLTKEELKEYNNLTKSIIIKKKELKKILDKNDKKNLKEEIDKLKISRKRIIKLAENKIPLLKKLLSDLKNDYLYYTIIYVEDHKQLKPVEQLLDELHIRYNKIIQSTKTNKRMQIIKDFEDKKIQIIIAEKIFDQGINIEALKKAIILSSTVNERQYIQRRGRLLRKYFNKEFAEIYDFVIIEKNITGDIKRAKIFYSCCSNKKEVLNKFREKNIIL